MDYRTLLIDRFVERLLAVSPQSVLDVGCGSGALLSRYRAIGLDAVGVEPDPAVAVRDGLPVIRAQAEQLPMADATWDWLTMRHVPHHLADPAAAFSEALRVCRTGLLLAEPYFEPRLPSQRNALAVDRWLKRQHRRAGQLHNESMDPQAICASLPAGVRVEFEVILGMVARPLSSFVDEAAPLRDALPDDHEDRGGYEELCAAIGRDGLTWNGTLIAAVRA